MGVWQNSTFQTGDKVWVPIRDLSKFSWSTCPNTDTRSNIRLGNEESTVNKSAARFRNDVDPIAPVMRAQINFINNQVPVFGREINQNNLLSVVSRNRHQFNLTFPDKNGVFGNTGTRNLLLTNNFSDNANAIWKMSSDGFTVPARNLVVNSVHNASGNTITVGTVLTLGGGVTNGRLNVKASDGTASNEFDIALSLETANNGSSFAALVGNTWLVGFLSGANTGDPIFVDINGNPTDTAATNREIGTMVCPASNVSQVGIITLKDTTSVP